MATVTLGREHDGATVPVHVGDQVTVRLDEPAGATGYVWALLPADGVATLGEPTYTPAEPVTFGSGGTRVFRLSAQAAGPCRLTFLYRRAWEQDDVVDRVTVDLDVQDG